MHHILYDFLYHVQETGYRNGHDETDTITVSSSFTNGVLGSTSPELLPPSIEVSPESTLQKPRHSVSLDDLDIRREEVRESLSPDLLMAGSALTPGRRSMQALKKVRIVLIVGALTLCIH